MSDLGRGGAARWHSAAELIFFVGLFLLCGWCPAPVSRPYVAFKRVVPDSLHPGLMGRRAGLLMVSCGMWFPTAMRARPARVVSGAGQAAAASWSVWSARSRP
ncbi:MAG: hypothetical protein ACRDS1_03685, partial [Pseudonocardiaceae bacterium]